MGEIMSKTEYLYKFENKIDEFIKICDLLLSDDEDIQTQLKWLSITPTFLFYGLPGTGKTTLAYKTYSKLKEKHNINIYQFNIEEILSSNFGESSQNLINFISKIKDDINRDCLRAFVIIDEIDSIALHRFTSDNSSMQRVLNTFNKEIDDLKRSGYIDKMIIIGTTNLKELIDTSVQRRFYFHIDFDSVLSESEFKEYIDGILKPFGKLNSISKKWDFKDLYDIYSKKQFTLGELKRIIANMWIDDTLNCAPCSKSISFKDYLSREKSYYETFRSQEEALK